MPADYCPFCPGVSDEVPENFDVVAISNKHPSLLLDPPKVSFEGDDFYRVAPADGVCEVLVYSGDHDSVLEDHPVDHIKGLIDLWQNRFDELGSLPHVRYVFIFENRGKEIGVTLQHPHGQIYAYPFVPRFVERRLEGSRKYFEERGRCLFCDIIEREEKARPSRIVLEDRSFLAFVPFWAKWSYEVSVYPKRHFNGLDAISEDEKIGLAGVMKRVMLKYDRLFGFRLPFIMAVHQRPTHGSEGYQYYHMSIEFYPPHRSSDNLKYLGGSETGAGAHINVTKPEQAAEELRGLG